MRGTGVPNPRTETLSKIGRAAGLRQIWVTDDAFDARLQALEDEYAGTPTRKVLAMRDEAERRRRHKGRKISGPVVVTIRTRAPTRRKAA